MKKIKKPDWFGLTIGELNDWFDERVEPVNRMLGEAVEIGIARENDGKWFTHYGYETHTALLINIQPVKKESVDDVLRDVCLFLNSINGRVKDNLMDQLCSELHSRVQGVIDEK